MPGRRLLEADRPERVGRRCAVAILVEFDLPRDALVIVSGVRERGAKRGGVGVRAGCHERAYADPDRVVRRQPERIDGGLDSTGDPLQQRVVTVLGALRERDQRAREAAGFLGERDGLGVVDELLRLRRAVTAVPRGLVEALHRSGGGQDVGDLLEAGQVHRSVAAGLRHLLRDRLERGAEVGGVRRVAEPVGDRDALGGCRRAHGVGQALVAPIVAPERYDRLLAVVLAASWWCPSTWSVGDESEDHVVGDPVSTMSSVTCAFFSWWLRRLTATSSAARLVLPSDDPAPVIDSNAPTRTSVLLDLRRRRQRTECKHGRERDDRAIGQRTAE